MKLEKILDQLNSFEKNTFLKIIDLIISENPKISVEIDKIISAGSKELKDMDNINESNEGNQFNDIVQPINGEPIVKKNVNSAFIGTNLKEELNNDKISKLVIVGLMTDSCVSSTTRMAGNFGFNTFLVSDATATFNKKGINGQDFSAELMHQTAMASLNEEFATIVTTNDLKKAMSTKQK